jgi:hypothetical protein
MLRFLPDEGEESGERSNPMATERASSSSIPALTSPSPGANRRSGERRYSGRKFLSGLPVRFTGGRGIPRLAILR